jgi:hypothetical protein
MRSWQSEKDNTGVTSRHGNSAPNSVALYGIDISVPRASSHILSVAML